MTDLATLRNDGPGSRASNTSRPGSRGSPRCSDATASSPPSRPWRSCRRWRSRRSRSSPGSRRRPTTRGATPSRARSSTRCGPARWRGPARLPARRLLRQRRLDAAVADPARRDARLDRRRRAGRPAWPNALAALAWIDRLGRPRWRRLRRVPAPLAARAAQPGLEGLRRRDPPSRRPSRRGPDRPGRGPGLRLCRASADGPARPSSRRHGACRPPRRRRRRASAPVRCGVLGRRIGFYAMALDGDKRPAATHHLEPGAGALGRDRPAGAGRGGRRADARARHVLGLGVPDLRGGPARLQPGRLSHRLGLAARQRADRGRLQGTARRRTRTCSPAG